MEIMEELQYFLHFYWTTLTSSTVIGHLDAEQMNIPTSNYAKLFQKFVLGVNIMLFTLPHSQILRSDSFISSNREYIRQETLSSAFTKVSNKLNLDILFRFRKKKLECLINSFEIKSLCIFMLIFFKESNVSPLKVSFSGTKPQCSLCLFVCKTHLSDALVLKNTFTILILSSFMNPAFPQMELASFFKRIRLNDADDNSVVCGNHSNSLKISISAYNRNALCSYFVRKSSSNDS
ncbi:hypothetical protein EGR_03868 [Echinococcus granulosus]|uniref:Uncharacterized protein n=1 Tax=Echinococcus granulosus TaxID=6210 RepID=W6UJH3_ECHGR|nr:hypothetical protein EGR_03868 [Echinococcus granulosus]EUB61193.1 hypothetical protein EGR_03868 [Echinococcus granulosus]